MSLWSMGFGDRDSDQQRSDPLYASQSGGPVEELVVPYLAGPTLGKLATRRRMLRSRVISLAITCVVLIAVFIWQRDRFTGSTAVGVVYGLVVASSIAWVIASALLYGRAKRAAESLGQGVAVRINRDGVQVADAQVGWDDVVGLAAAQGPLGGGPTFRLTRASGPPVAVPFDQLDVRPATLDSVARAFSGGRHGVDLSALDG